MLIYIHFDNKVDTPSRKQTLIFLYESLHTAKSLSHNITLLIPLYVHPCRKAIIVMYIRIHGV